MILRCLKDKNSAFVLGVGQILMFSSILLLASMYSGLSFAIEIHSPVSFLSDSFVKGFLTGFSGAMLGLSVVFNIQGMVKLRKEREMKRNNERNS